MSYRNLVIIVLLLLLGGGGLAIWNAEQNVSKRPVKAPETQATQGSQMIGHNVSFTVTEGEVKKWTLVALQAIYNESRTEAHLTGVTGQFYDKDGKPVLQFSAPKGEYLNKNNAVELTGGVIAKSTRDMGAGGKGGELHAPKMVWNAKTDQVTASGGIELTFPQGKSLAQTCHFTLDFSNIILEGSVTSTFMSQTP
jgi:LPS export ABC transporter protein LptC